MANFITYRELGSDGELKYYILQKAFPHVVGVVSGVPSELKPQSPIPGYMLWVVFDGTIRGNSIPSYGNAIKEVYAILDKMASWFYTDRILKFEKKFKKFKILNNANTINQ